jgi:hypothetical protein
VPLPDPLDPEVTVIHAALLAADQPQPAAVATATLPLPPLDVNDWLVGDMPKVHALACVTVNVCPAMAIVPVRPPPVLAATV